MAKAYAPSPPALELVTRARRRLEAPEGEVFRFLEDPAIVQLKGRLHMAIDRVTDIEARRLAATAWLREQADAGSDHQGISAVRQGIRKLDDELATEAAKMNWLEEGLADHRSARQAQPSASSQCSGNPQSFGPVSQLSVPEDLAMSGSFMIEEVP